MRKKLTWALSPMDRDNVKGTDVKRRAKQAHAFMSFHANHLSFNAAKTQYEKRTLERHAKDIKEEFPDLSGFSLRNLKYRRRFAECFPVSLYFSNSVSFGHLSVEIPFFHEFMKALVTRGQGFIGPAR